MKLKTSVTFMVAIVLAIVTAKVGMDTLKKYGHGAGAESRVVVAKRDMEPGYVIAQGDVALQEIPAALMNSKMLTNPKDLIGRTVVSTIATNYPLSEAVLAPAGSGSGMQ